MTEASTDSTAQDLTSATLAGALGSKDIEVDPMTDKEKVPDPTFHYDLQLTRTEWTVYWKTKYEDSIKRIVEAKTIVDQQNIAINKLRGQLHA